MMAIIRACHHGTSKMCNKVCSGRASLFLERDKKWVLNCSRWWPLQSLIVGGLIRCCLSSASFLPCFIRIISSGYGGRPGCVSSFHELWDQPALLRRGLGLIELRRESAVLLRHHQGERHVWVLFLSSSPLVTDSTFMPSPPDLLDCWCYCLSS